MFVARSDVHRPPINVDSQSAESTAVCLVCSHCLHGQDTAFCLVCSHGQDSRVLHVLTARPRWTQVCGIIVCEDDAPKVLKALCISRMHPSYASVCILLMHPCATLSISRMHISYATLCICLMQPYATLCISLMHPSSASASGPGSPRGTVGRPGAEGEGQAGGRGRFSPALQLPVFASRQQVCGECSHLFNKCVHV